MVVVVSVAGACERGVIVTPDRVSYRVNIERTCSKVQQQRSPGPFDEARIIVKKLNEIPVTGWESFRVSE